mmetsp:Transcript_110891/g.298915  ORF Transcript_110891/g.298915 Transcript_110891/m.298915 type:complete len:251 (+) Transcript_110891:1-753(+)
MEKRQRRLEELRSAKEMVDECLRRNLGEHEHNFQMAQQEFRIAHRHFEKVDRHVFEWLYILEEHREDILDSSLQTLRYLQYEFFAQSAHALSHALPDQMDFRPMGDMDPELLRTRVCEIDASMVEGESIIADVTYSKRLVQCLAHDPEKDDDVSSIACAVDILSLSSLLAQGFEEGQARKALRLHDNNTQLALEWMLGGGEAVSDNLVRPQARQQQRGHRRLDGLAVHQEAARKGNTNPMEPRPAELGTR